MKVYNQITVELTTDNIKEAVVQWLDRQDIIGILAVWHKSDVEIGIKSDPYQEFTDSERVYVKVVK